MDPIKESFQKVKGDIYSLKAELNDIKKELNEIQNSILTLIKTTQNNQDISLQHLRQTNRLTNNHFDRHFDTSFNSFNSSNSFNTSTNQPTNRQTNRQISQKIQQTNNQNSQIYNQIPSSTHYPTQNIQNSTIRQINQTEKSLSTHNSTDILPFKSLKRQNIPFSIRNKGVSTDRQTDQQTDTSTGNKGVISSKEFRENTQNLNLSSISPNPSNLAQFSASSIPQAKEVRTITTTIPAGILLNQLDSLKKEIRLKVKRLTPQEMLVLSFIYQLEDQGYLVDYPLLSSKLSLSQSSIRDYIQRIINKGFSLSKEKVNNKQVILHIADDFRQLVSLDTLIKLREI